MVEAADGTLFKAEYEQELEAWLRRRFGWLLGVTIAYLILALLATAGVALVAKLEAGPAPGEPAAAAAAATQDPAYLGVLFLGTILNLAIAARAFVFVRPKLETREQTLQAANWFLLQTAMLTLGADLMTQYLLPPEATEPVASGLTNIFFLHFFASVFLPWSPRESLRPMYPILSGFIMEFAVLKALGRIGMGETVGALLGAPLMLVPGLAISAWRLRRHRRRFDRSMVTKGFFAMRRELSQARSVQMALFPAAIHRPELDFDYAYQPANEVGGDFIHASVDAKGRLDIVLMDVTGHGLASALTVARLSGEIERLLAEDPDIAPGAVLRALNRYVSLTLSRHSVYLTALAIQVDPAHGTVRYVNAGHPPAWVRRGDGSVERFDSTTFLLGAVPDDEFDAEEREIALGPADTLVLVTDGVHEAPDRAGRQFGLERIRDAIARMPAGARLAQQLSTAVEQWRGRVGDDDVLVATVRVPQAVPVAPGALDRAAEIEAHVTLGEPAGTPA
ncbi:MAG: PP2C family protein-serine/threonine phosphatase [Phycisphaerales bacterium]